MSKLKGTVHFATFCGLIALMSGSAVGCREVTEKVIEKGVQAAKDTTTGIESGVEKGRKSGVSADGAAIVSSHQDLVGKGSIVVYALRPTVTDPKGAEVDLALENTTDKPLRVTNLEVLALDKEGFVKRPLIAPAELTVPPQAKDKLTVTFPAEAATLAKVRIWDKESDVPSAH
jgi:hypothetical protein